MAINIQKIYTDGDVKKCASALLTEFGKARVENESISDAFKGNYGALLRQKSIIIYSKEAQRLERELAERIEKLLPPKFASISHIRKSVSDIAANVAETDGNFDDFKQKLREYLEAQISHEYEIYFPNNIFTFENITSLEIGPVNLILRNSVADKANQEIESIREQKPNAKLGMVDDTGDDLKLILEAGVVLSVPSSDEMWSVKVNVPPQLANEEAFWKIRVACSLIRFMGQTWTGASYTAEKLERHPTIFDKHMGQNMLRIGDNQVSVGDGTVFPRRPLTPALKAEIECPDSVAIIKSVMDYKPGTVGERVYLALGWISTGRQTTDRSERFLALMTALETLLARGSNAPVKETIARLGSVVLANTIEDREGIASHLGKIYNERSAIVHNGQRIATDTLVKNALIIVESIAYRILKESDLSEVADKFIQRLVSSTYGSEWKP